MKGILIDPKAQTLTEVDVGDGRFSVLYDLMDCDTVDLVYIGKPGARATIVVDDEGLLKSGPRSFFMYADHDGARGPMAGKAVVLGLTEPDGDLCDSPLTLEMVRARVRWPDAETVRQFRDRGGFDTRITGFGQPTTTIPVRPDIADPDDSINRQDKE